MATADHGRFRYSIRTLLLATAACAALLTPVAWVARERRQMLAAQEAVLQARAVAMESVAREVKRRRADSTAGDTPSIERLKRENESLRQEVESLRREVQELKNATKPAARANP
jgi:hypothetical protein